jgi:hypothetical protein
MGGGDKALITIGGTAILDPGDRAAAAGHHCHHPQCQWRSGPVRALAPARGRRTPTSMPRRCFNLLARLSARCHNGSYWLA